MALTAVIALEHNHPVAHREIGAVDDIHYGANALMPEVLRVVMKFKVVFCPDARAFETNRRDLCFDHDITGLDAGIRLLDQGGFTRLRYGQHGVHP